MGADAVGLIVDWEPVVAACASAGSVRFGWRNPDGGELRLRSPRARRLVNATFAGTPCAFYWDETGELWVRAQGKHVLRRDNRGEIVAQPRKSGKPVDLKLDAIPCVDIRRLPGPGRPIVEAGQYYRQLRDGLPQALRCPTDALIGTLYPAPAEPDDLSTDASVALTSPVVYGLRPTTVSEAVRHAADIPWAALRAIAGGTPDHETFENTMLCQIRWLTEAAGRRRGVIALLFQ